MSAVKLTIAVIGDGGVGKSSLTLSFLKRDFSEDYDPTVEDAYSITLPNVDGQQVQVDIIDTAGQEEYRGLFSETQVRLADGFIMVFDVSNRETFEALPTFLNIVRATKSPIDHPPTTNSPENNPFVYAILGNKTDLPPQRRQVTAADGLQYARTGGALFFETSAKQGVNVEQSFTSVIKAILRARALDTSTRKPGHKRDSFNPNVAIVEEKLAQRQNLSVSMDEKNIERTAPRKKNPNLAMDRANSKSIGGLADGEHDKGGCKCIIQ